MSVVKAQFDLLKQKHPHLEVKYSQLEKLRESEWQHLYKVDQKFHNIRQSLHLEKLSRKEKRQIIGQPMRRQ